MEDERIMLVEHSVSEFFSGIDDADFYIDPYGGGFICGNGCIGMMCD